MYGWRWQDERDFCPSHHEPGDPWWDQIGYVTPEDRFDVPALHVNSWYDLGVNEKVAAETDDRHYSPFVGRDYPDQVLFGDTHFHTNLSFDAGLVGTSLDVDAGYRFARGDCGR